MSVTLRKRKNSDGSTTLRLDIYHNGARTVETLKNLKLSKPSNLTDREHNKARLRQAEQIAITRAAELEASNYNMTTDSGKKTIIAEWMQSYIDGYTKKDKRNMSGVANRFSTFLSETGRSGLTFGGLTALTIEEFIEFLESKSIGEGASSYYNRFKKMIRHAYRKSLMKENILEHVEKKVRGKAKKKDTLTLEELKKLAFTPIENPEIKNAFLFTCVTGLRWIDIKTLSWKDIDLKNSRLSLTQSKTGEIVSVPLNGTAVKILSNKPSSERYVFQLPTANGANKTLKSWVKRAEIQKKITWHNGRHSFGTNLIYNNVDILTTSKLLGHTSLKHTNRYVTAAEEMKQNATNAINIDI